MKAPSESHICIYLREIAVDVRIGLHASEAKPQRVLVTVELYADPSYLKDVTEETIIDYKRIHDAVMEWPGRDHVKLVETYARELLDLAFGFQKVEAARVSVTKADIFPKAAGAGVEIFMTREDYFLPGTE
nr:dihydroneopterin aldolase [uncultured bacterium]